MARPSFKNITQGLESWDGPTNDNKDVFEDAPWPVYEHTGDESDLATTFTPSAFDRCIVMVNHTTLGWTMYASNGTTWRILAVLDPTAITALTDNSGGTASDTIADVPATYNETTMANIVASLTAKINELRDAMVERDIAS